jgi:hypothetical protein
VKTFSFTAVFPDVSIKCHVRLVFHVERSEQGSTQRLILNLCRRPHFGVNGIESTVEIRIRFSVLVLESAFFIAPNDGVRRYVGV